MGTISQSCLVTEDSSSEIPNNVIIPRNPAYALCSSGDSDYDEDGWGWEKNATCQVESRVDFSTPEVVSRPLCERPWLDYDGDGWGYENGRSCRAIR